MRYKDMRRQLVMSAMMTDMCPPITEEYFEDIFKKASFFALLLQTGLIVIDLSKDEIDYAHIR